MATDKTAAEGTSTEKSTKKQGYVYRMDAKDIPENVHEAVAGKLGAKADVYPARNDGGYKGPVIHADQDYIVQAVGKNQESAVVHKRSDINLKGEYLVGRAANNSLSGENIQVHYRGSDEKGNAYTWDRDKEAQQRAAAAERREKGIEAPKKEEVAYRMKGEDIPQNIREAVSDKLGAKATVYPPREETGYNGYKGPVIHADKDYIVQAVGKNQDTAIAHRRSDLSLEGPKLVTRDKNNDLAGRNLQIYYHSGQPGKAYTWDAEKEAQQRAASAERRASEADKKAPAKDAAAKADKQQDASAKQPEKASKEQPAKQSGKSADKATPQRGGRAAKQDRQPEPALER